MAIVRPRGNAIVRSVGLLAFALAATLAACGTGYLEGTSTSGTSTTGTPITCASPTAGASADRASAVRSSGAAAHVLHVVPVTTLPPGVVVGRVQIELRSSSYGPCDTIMLYAGNGLEESIFAADHQSGCSIVTLQRQNGSAWQPMARCLLASPTRLVEISVNNSEYVELHPSIAGAPGASWPVGTYRVAFSYNTGQANGTPATTVYSATFTIA